jgi:hypothetical protein
MGNCNTCARESECFPLDDMNAERCYVHEGDVTIWDEELI